MTADHQKAVVLLQGEDFDTHTTWYWWWLDDADAGPKLGGVDEEVRDALLDELERALPTPLRRETQWAALERALAGPLVVPSAERALSQRLGAAFLSTQMIAEIFQRLDAGIEVELRITPSPRCARIPWLLLVPTLPPGSAPRPWSRLGQLVTVVDEAPASIHVGRARIASDPGPDARLLAVVDPDLQVRGTRLLTDEQRQLLAHDSRIQPGSLIDARLLSDELRRAPTPSGLLLVGHVENGQRTGAGTSFKLSPVRGVEEGIPASAAAGQLSAADLVLGDRARGGATGAEIWPMPPRIALVACSSGGDLGRREPFGLVVASLNAGARWAAVTRWVLPSDRLFREHDHLLPDDAQPFFEIAEAVREAMIARDSTAWLVQHLREKIRTWDEMDDAADARQFAPNSPLTWGSLAIFSAEERASSAWEATLTG